MSRFAVVLQALGLVAFVAGVVVAFGVAAGLCVAGVEALITGVVLEREAADVRKSSA